MAHVPMMFNNSKIPKKVLILGGGDGILTKELLRHKNIESITLIDIDKTMLRLSNTHPLFLKMNERSLQDKRVRVIRNDAFYYLNRHKEKYDAIYMDFTFPFSFDVARLYSVEFLSIVSKSLKDNGQLIHSTPFPQTKEDDIDLPFYDKLISSTYGSAGFKSLLMYSDAQNSFLIASKTDKQWSEQFNSLGLDYKTDTNAVFREKIYRYIPEYRDREMTNSLFKPIFMGLKDLHY
jgi:spermidine synthase